METHDFSDSFARFAELMTEQKAYLDTSLTFLDACHIIGADPESLEKEISEELGVDGEELMAEYRDSSEEYMADSY